MGARHLRREHDQESSSVFGSDSPSETVPHGRLQTRSGRKQLAIALVVGEGQVVSLTTRRNPLRSTAMLNVGPSGFADRTQIKAVPSLNKLSLVLT